MNNFLHSVHVWLLSVWSHHPITWERWAIDTYALFATIGLLLWGWGRKSVNVIMVIAALSAAIMAIDYAYRGSAFGFWVWLVVALALASRLLWRLRVWLKKRRAAQAARPAPSKTKPAA